MNNYLKSYDATITALSPIHVGSGNLLLKKEYIFDKQKNVVMVLNPAKFYDVMVKMRMEKQFQDFMFDSTQKDLSWWLRNNGIPYDKCMRAVDYILDSGDTIMYKKGSGAFSVKGISVFSRDAYNLPYVPGSSIKGMLRTALLSYLISIDGPRFSKIHNRICNTNYATDYNRKPNKKFINHKTADIENVAFNTLAKSEKPWDAVNSVMAGLRVSDSDVISNESLTLSQKIDLNLRDKELELPLLRESLKPGTEVRFRITIDTSVFPFTMEDILSALNMHNSLMNDYFYSKFKRSNNDENIVWLGGGVGMPSKTVIEALCREKSLDVDNVLGNKTYRMHKHYQDKDLGISPHVCKCTRYNGQLYNMGMGRFEATEIDF